MSAPLPAEPGIPPRRRRFRTPVAGWSSALYLVVMLAAAGFILDAPAVVGNGPSGASQTAFLVRLLPAMGILALVISLLPVRDLLAHLVGAAVAAALVVISCADAISAAPDAAARLADLNASAARLYEQVFVQGTRTDETSGFLLAVGCVAATTGWFSGWNLFRRGLVAPALVAVTALVVVSCLSPAADVAELYPALVVLTAAALLLVLRTNLARRQSAWIRGGFIDAGAAGRLVLAGGMLLAVGALAVSAVVATRLTAAPLAASWSEVDRVPEILEELDRIFGRLGGGMATGGGTFGDRTSIESTWETSNAVVFTATTEDGRGLYWVGGAYDRFDGRGWLRGPTERRRVGTLEDALAGSAEAASLPGSVRRLRVLIEAGSLGGGSVVAPALTERIDREVDVITASGGGPILALEPVRRIRRGEEIALEVLVPTEGGQGITQARLAGAGLVYPAWALDDTRVEPGTLSDRAVGIAAALVASLPEDERDPYHVARAMERWFATSGDFRYETDVTGACRPGEGVVDCLLRSRVGFCQHYATAMTLLLRSRSIPARYVQGYLPGRQAGDATWVVEASAAHAWVEVWFPGFGWVRFDPTPGGNAANGQETSSFPEGRPVPTPTPDPELPEPTPAFSDPPPTLAPEPTPTPAVAPVVPPAPGGPPDPILPGLLLLVLGVLALVGIRTWRTVRIPGRDPELLWRGIVRLAAPAWRRPVPAETAFEYTELLAERLPAVGEELHALAKARVALVYGGRPMPEGESEGLLGAYRRVRAALLGARFRRPRR